MIEPGQDKGKSYIEHTAEKAGTSYKAKLKTAIDRLIPQVSDFEELLTKSYSPRSSFPFMEDVSGESSPFATKDSLVLFPHFAAKGLRVNACFPCLRHFHHTALIELVAAQSLVTVHPRNEDEIIEVVGILFELLIVRQPQGCFLDSQQLFKLMVGQIGEFLCQHCQIIHMGIHGESEPEPRHIRHIIIKEIHIRRGGGRQPNLCKGSGDFLRICRKVKPGSGIVTLSAVIGRRVGDICLK